MYITPKKVFSHLDRLAAWQSGQKAGPVTVEWDLSNACSLGCQSCHFAHTHVKGPWARLRVLPTGYTPSGEFADPILVSRGLREMYAVGVRGVVWSGGGEPTLHPNWVDILAYAKSIGFKQGMYTLGGHLTVESSLALAAAAEWVVVSLDAATGPTYAAEKGVGEARFDQACAGIQLLAEARQAVVGVSFLVHAGNWEQVSDMYNLAMGMGATYVTFRPTVDTKTSAPAILLGDRAWVTPMLDLLAGLPQDGTIIADAERFRGFRDWAGHGYATCYGIRMNTVVTPDGRVWLCQQRRGMDGSCVGDLREESFAAVWSRHPGHYLVNDGCRAMCRLHQVNQELATVYAPAEHTAFV